VIAASQQPGLGYEVWQGEGEESPNTKGQRAR